MIENIDTNGEWTTVTFYVRKGESALNYRLEVWSGTRDGKTVNTTGIVAFDTNNPGTASSNFDTLIEEFEDTATSKFDSVFSYFDTDMHVRFDAEKDTEKRGNAYEDNAKATLTAEASTAYLKHYSDATGYNVFADYSLSDKTVAASEQTDDDHDHEDSSDEETTASAADGWLLASSIAVAAVLVLAVASVAARKILDKVRRNRGKKVRKEKAEKAPKQKKVEKTVDEDSPYND
jgi:heme exporter protein D